MLSFEDFTKKALKKNSLQGDPLRALTTSISFGRFVSESLAWEKWSCFSNNRYLEEAERYSKPGSVAEKKAYFEAHYKRIAAAKKAAALLEQRNTASNKCGFHEPNIVDDTQDSSSTVSESSKSDNHVGIDKMQENEALNTQLLLDLVSNFLLDLNSNFLLDLYSKS